MRKTHLFAITCLFSLLTKAQLQVGSAVPDPLLTNVINHKTATLRLSDFRGRLLIIDFWNTGCKSCLKSFPKLDSIQKALNGQVQFILVTAQSAADLEDFYRKHPKLPRPPFPCVTADTVLKALFPHIYVPHHVWIDSKGIVRQITGSNSTTLATVKGFLAGENLVLYRKEDSAARSFKLPDNYDSRVRSFSCLLPKLKRLKAANNFWIKEGGKPIGLHFDAASIVDLFRAVIARHPMGGTWLNNRVIVEAEGPFFRPEESERWDQWADENTYRYTIWKQGRPLEDVFRRMYRELEEEFGLEAVVEKRPVTSWVLRCTDTLKLRSAGGKQVGYFNGEAKLVAKNMTLSWAVQILATANAAKKEPLVDGTGFTGPADIELEGSLTDFAALRPQLEKQGLELVQEVREIDMLIIRPVNERRMMR